MPSPSDGRSDEAAAYRALYRTARWQRLRRRILVRDRFLCQRTGVLLREGRSHPYSAVVHHKTPHKGDPALFYDPDNLEAVAKSWHDQHAQSAERRGYSSEIGEDGFPIDDAHPFNRTR